MAEARGVRIIFGKVIYELVESVRDILLAALPPVTEERVTGTAEVRKYTVLASGQCRRLFVGEGEVLAESRMRLLRDGVVVYEGVISFFAPLKESVKTVRMGEECGIGVRRFNDIKVGDVIESLEIIQKAAEI